MAEMEAKLDSILAQLAALTEEVRSTRAKVDEHDKLLEKLVVEPRGALAAKVNTTNTEQRSAVKFSADELTDFQIMSGIKGKGVTTQNEEACEQPKTVLEEIHEEKVCEEETMLQEDMATKRKKSDFHTLCKFSIQICDTSTKKVNCCGDQVQFLSRSMAEHDNQFGQQIHCYGHVMILVLIISWSLRTSSDWKERIMIWEYG
ncbi:Uncharacterized protein Rs2_27134 [Raphanus sativus]|nr:Uncharacterized protein Rs2_27134 [Raphanus sativus]